MAARLLVARGMNACRNCMFPARNAGWAQKSVADVRESRSALRGSGPVSLVLCLAVLARAFGLCFLPLRLRQGILLGVLVRCHGFLRSHPSVLRQYVSQMTSQPAL